MHLPVVLESLTYALFGRPACKAFRSIIPLQNGSSEDTLHSDSHAHQFRIPSTR
jgi:hypothetical protein